MGYLLAGTQFNNNEFEAIEQSKTYKSAIPDVILVKKHYPRRKKASGQKRNWKLKRMAKEESEMAPRKQDQERLERDFELFLRDVEEDEELRHTMQVYKAQQEANAMEMETDDEDEDEQGPQIPMDQLLDEFEEMNMQDAA